MQRRRFLAGLAGAPLAAAAAVGTRADQARPAGSVLRARRLRAGDTVGVITPATATYQQVELDIVRESLEGLGLKVRIGEHVLSRHGSLGGTDAERAGDVNAFARNRCARSSHARRLEQRASAAAIDYGALRNDPRIILGYSDITALLNGIHAQTGLVTFHGPNGGGRWDQTSPDWMKRVRFDGEAITPGNPKSANDRNVLAQIDNRTQKINGGRARVRLVGGNLSVFTTLLGSPYVPPLDGAILFLEDTGEQFYRIDRMFTQLKLAGVLAKIRGFVFGTCNECTPGDGFASLTPEEIFADHIAPLGIPAWTGAMIGHAMTQWTLPVGADVEIDADTATLSCSNTQSCKSVFL